MKECSKGTEAWSHLLQRGECNAPLKMSTFVKKVRYLGFRSQNNIRPWGQIEGCVGPANSEDLRVSGVAVYILIPNYSLTVKPLYVAMRGEKMSHLNGGNATGSFWT